jgi:DNA-binding MarR family transcriptional regulator
VLRYKWAEANGLITKSPAVRRPATAPEEPVDYRALAEFRFAIRKFLAFSADAATAAGLTSRQHQALLMIKALANGEGLPVGVLAERLLVRQHTAVELVDRLERSGLARRGADPQDGRRVLVSMTREGEKRLRSLSGVHLAELQSLAPALVAILADLQGGPPPSG